VIGALFKVQQWPLARTWQIAGWLFSAIMTVVVAVEILSHPGFKEFLDN
jgi:CBS-domain-containing membrane protein